MPKIVKPLTNSQVESAKYEGKPYKMFDGDGLFLWVRKHGKFWYFSYTRPFLKKKTTLSLGKFPVISLKAARQLRNELALDLARRIDPQVKMQEIENELKRKNEATLEVVYKNWKEARQKQIKQHTMYKNEMALNKHILSKIGNMPLEQITIPFLIEFLKPLDKQQKFATKKRILNLMKQISSYATIVGILNYNPLSEVGKIPIIYNAKHQTTIEPNKLPYFLERLFNSNETITNKILIIWQLLTMLRPAEAVTVEWQDIDLDNKIMTIPAEKMKGQLNKGKPHSVPLSDQAINLILELQRITGRNQYIFPTKTEHSIPSKARAIRILWCLGYKGELTAHGFRSIASTYLNDVGVEGDLIEACLAHTVGNAVRNAYNRSTFLDRRRPVMQQWADYVEQCAGGDLIAGIYRKVER